MGMNLHRKVYGLERALEARKPRPVPRMITIHANMTLDERAEAVKLFAYNKSLPPEVLSKHIWLIQVVCARGQGEDYQASHELVCSEMDSLVAEVEAEAESLLKRGKRP
jgi:hypothetical protein